MIQDTQVLTLIALSVHCYIYKWGYKRHDSWVSIVKHMSYSKCEVS